jgi:hypothetical protein
MNLFQLISGETQFQLFLDEQRPNIDKEGFSAPHETGCLYIQANFIMAEEWVRVKDFLQHGVSKGVCGLYGSLWEVLACLRDEFPL